MQTSVNLSVRCHSMAFANASFFVSSGKVALTVGTANRRKRTNQNRSRARANAPVALRAPCADTLRPCAEGGNTDAKWQNILLSATMCKIKGCQGKVVVRGLYAKHYMRERRTGYPTKIGKPGPAPSLYMAMAKVVSEGEWSPRTMARYAEASRILDGCSAPARAALLKACTRPNGSINVGNLLDRAAMLWSEEHPDDQAALQLTR
jgi:hypothetical protein